MKKITKKWYLIILAIFIWLILTTKSFAGDQDLNELNFTVDLQSNGDMKVTEIWDVDIYDTNTLFKNFKYDSNKFENVSVTDVSTGVEFSQINELMYHVTKNCFYAMRNDDGLFEIAWGVDVNNSQRKKYQIEYTVKDIINMYNDCSELYWQFIGKNFSIPARKVTGYINLPMETETLEDLKVWAHGPLTGNINKISKNQVFFEVDNLSTSDFLEVRIATPNYVFSESTNNKNTNNLEQILQEETAWAEEANRQREAAQKAEEEARVGATIFLTIANIVYIALCIKIAKDVKKIKKIKPTQEIKYFRDIPDEDSSPAEAAFLYYFKINKPNSKIISAIMMDLALKGFIEFEIDSQNKKKVKVIIKGGGKELPKDESEVFTYLKRVAGNNGYFTMKEFEKYSSNHPTLINRLMEKINQAGEKINVEKDIYSQNEANKSIGYGAKGIAVIGIATFLCAVAGVYFPEGAGCLITIGLFYTIMCFIASSRYNGLTQKGVDRREEWKGLKRYMENFSMLDEREVPELVLWEKYLVYATAFGIAEKVLKQLKVKYPELTEDAYYYDKMRVMYVMSHTDFSKSVETPISRSVLAGTSYSSGSGGGGGFSGGGGGGAGGGGGGGR